MYTTNRRIDKTADRFDECRDDRMLVGSVLAYLKNLMGTGNPDLLEKRAESAVREIEEAIRAMDRVALVCIKAETAATLAGEFDKPEGRNLLDDGPDYEDAAEWPAWTDDTHYTTEPTPLAVLAAFGIPPISGGSPEAYQPTDDDLDEYAAWSTGLTFDDHLRDIYEGHELPETTGHLDEQDIIRVTGCC
jgi:hypothetical protein